MIILFIVSTILAPSNAVGGLDTEFRVVLPVECPCGIVSMWFGDLANIPTGYQLCNGKNGTPDLQGRFPIGIAAEGEPSTPGDQGGNENCEVNITEANLPSHTHNITAVNTDDSQGGHSHDITGTTSEDGKHDHTFNLSADTSGSHNHGLSGGNCNYNYAFVMDESGSVGSTNYQISIDFVIDLIRNNIANTAQLMALSFNHHQDWIYQFSQTQLPREKLSAGDPDLIIDELTIEKSDFSGGNTGTKHAMEAAITEFQTNNFTENNILILVTDGRPTGLNSNPCDSSVINGINNTNIRVIIVGVGGFNPAPVACLVNDPADIIDIANFNFDPVVTRLQQLQVICDNGAGTDMEPHHMHGVGTLSADNGGEHKHDLDSYFDNDVTTNETLGMVWDAIVDGNSQKTFQTLNMNGTHGHNISGDTGPDGAHDHGLIGNTDYDGDHEHNVIGTIDGYVNHSHTVIGTIDGYGEHNHTVTGITDATGGDVALNIKPPYTAVYFICCVGDVEGQ